MGVGFKVGGSGYFKSILSVVANPGAVVTIESDTSTQQKTADNNGNTSFIIKRKGHYTVTTDFGATAAIDILAYQNYSINVAFDATVRVQANPSAVVTLTNYNNNSIYYQATANSSTGIAVVSVKRAGSYTVSSNNAGGFTADGNTNSVTVNTNGSSQNIQFVKLNIPASLAVANYSSNALTAYWTRPGSLWTGVNLRRNTGSAPASRSAGTSVYTGAGNTGIVINNSNTVNGYTNTGLTANTKYYYSIFSYITINGTNYWATTYRTANGTAVNYVNSVETITSTRTWAVPAGWRKIKVCVVGGGGAGGNGEWDSDSWPAGGGGGGYVINTGDISVTPGQTFSVTVGSGGAASTSRQGIGGTGGQSKFGSYTANGGQGGSVAKSGNAPSGRYGGGAGGCGGGAGSRPNNATNGGAGGTNGGDGETTSTGYTSLEGGKGQGTTTKAFTTGTAYAGGGGGGTKWGLSGYSGGAGGAYGGGSGGKRNSTTAGSGSWTQATAGTANSGGGGGGGGNTSLCLGAAGGSGVVLVKCVA